MAIGAGKKVWVKDPKVAEEEVFVKGNVVSIDGKKVTVATESGTNVWDEALIYEVRTAQNTLGPKWQCEGWPGLPEAGRGACRLRRQRRWYGRSGHMACGEL